MLSISLSILTISSDHFDISWTPWQKYTKDQVYCQTLSYRHEEKIRHCQIKETSAYHFGVIYISKCEKMLMDYITVFQ